MYTATILIVVLLAIVEIALILLAGLLRNRFGWFSVKGQMIWLALGCPGIVAIFFAQVIVYWKIIGSNPFNDLVITAIITTGAIVTLGVIMYYAWIHRDDSKASPHN